MLLRFPSARTPLFALLLVASLPACQRRINMATVQSPTWNATTISYAGVREENRRYPDYSIINASILNSAASGAPKAPRSSQGTPR